jgi:hypothetical protein
MAALLADVDGDAEPLVARVLDRFDLALAHGDALADALGHFGFCRSRSTLDGLPQDIGGNRLELIGSEREIQDPAWEPTLRAGESRYDSRLKN